MVSNSAFPTGLRVFLRLQLQDGQLHSIDFLTGRSVEISEDLIFMDVKDGAEKYLGTFVVESVACILPLQTVGPAVVEGSDAKN